MQLKEKWWEWNVSFVNYICQDILYQLVGEQSQNTDSICESDIRYSTLVYFTITKSKTSNSDWANK